MYEQDGEFSRREGSVLLNLGVLNDGTCQKTIEVCGKRPNADAAE